MTAQEWYEKKFDKGSQIGLADYYEFVEQHNASREDRLYLIFKLDARGLIGMTQAPFYIGATDLAWPLIESLAKALEERL